MLHQNDIFVQQLRMKFRCGFTGLETREDESAEREELHRLISTLPIEKVRELLEELR